MNDFIERLTNRLLGQNDHISYSEARTWIELLWEDFEISVNNDGSVEKHSHKKTEEMFNHWIDRYGPRLHRELLEKPKYREWFNKKQFYH